MPDLIAFKGVSLARFVGQMTMSTEGIYGVPLHVSATIVFLFVLFGAMLEKAGAGMYFIQLALSLLGGFRGGPAKAAVLGSGLTGMVSGSSVANVVTTGTFTIPMMKKVGYPAKKAPAVPTGIQGFTYDIRTAILPLMFIFNSDLILHNIDSWPTALLIFAMTCMGSFAFASATQGWFIAKNRFYEVPLFIAVTLILMRPEVITGWLGLPHSQRFWCYAIGLVLYGLIYLLQKPRCVAEGPAVATASI
jgi:TRAP-type uncharacterized transport system fused permease subunit